MNLFLGAAEGIDPISQFEIKSLLDIQIGNLQLDFTNSTFFMVLAVVLTLLFFSMAANRGGVVPNRLQSMGELGYTFVADMIRGTAGEEGLRFFPFVFTLFFFIFFANMIGMIPFAFTTTSHVVVTALLALLVISIVIIYGFYKNGLKFLNLFAPAGAPWPIYIILIPIEIVSFIARPITLALRLFANMLAGHITLKLFASFTVQLMGAAVASSALLGVAGIMAFIFGVALNALEVLVAGLQAYVFAILTCVYLNDAQHPSH